jgi:hypothetical protein
MLPAGSPGPTTVMASRYSASTSHWSPTGVPFQVMVAEARIVSPCGSMRALVKGPSWLSGASFGIEAL